MSDLDNTKGRILIEGRLLIDFDAEKLSTEKEEKKISIKGKQCELLYYLWMNKNKVRSNDDIADNVWGRKGTSDENIRQHILKIRKSITELCDRKFADDFVQQAEKGYMVCAPEGSWRNISGAKAEESPDKDNEPDKHEDDINTKDSDHSDSPDNDMEHDSNDTTDEPSNVNIDIKDNKIVNMSHNILVIGFLTEIVTLFFKKINLRPSKKIFVILSIALLVIFTTALLCVRYSRYSDAANSAKKNFNEGNYDEAIELFEVAEHSAITISQRLDTKRSIGDCYLAVGISQDSTSDLATAIRYYSEILERKFDRTNETYADALAGTSLAYSFAKRPMDQQWTDLVRELSRASDKLKKIDISADPKTIDGDDLQHWTKIWFAMWNYYYTAIQTDYSFTYNTEILKKTLYYCENFSKCIEIEKKKNDEIAILLPQPDFESIAAELNVLIARSPETDDPEKYADKAIEICKVHLQGASGSGLDKPTYYSFKSLLGEAYRELGKLYSTSNPQKASEYMEQAYTIFSSLLDFDRDSDELELERVVNIGYNAIFTGKCTREDIEKILDKYDEFVSEIMENKDPRETARFALNIGDCCVGIIEFYGPNERAFEIGKTMTEKAKTVEEYVQESQINNFNKMYDYFHNDNA